MQKYTLLIKLHKPKWISSWIPCEDYQMTPERIIGLIESYSRTLELTEIEERLQKLEANSWIADEQYSCIR